MMSDSMPSEPENAEESAAEGGDERGESGGYSIVINCRPDGTHDVFTHPLIESSERDNPDGLFGLDSLEDALRGVIAIKKQGPDYASAEDEGMMQGYGGGSADDEEMGG